MKYPVRVRVDIEAQRNSTHYHFNAMLFHTELDYETICILKELNYIELYDLMKRWFPDHKFEELDTPNMDATVSKIQPWLKMGTPKNETLEIGGFYIDIVVGNGFSQSQRDNIDMLIDLATNTPTKF